MDSEGHQRVVALLEQQDIRMQAISDLFVQHHEGLTIKLLSEGGSRDV